MEIKLKKSTGEYASIEEFLKFSRTCGRQCYTGKDFEELEKEPYNSELVERMLEIGHHSVFEHQNLTFSMTGIPKALVMILNNEKQYATSEKSARYTQMKDIEPKQKEKYDKWMKIFIPKISEIYPQMSNDEKRKSAIKKLAQENARYMTSVFTPTKMIHTINLRQLNHIAYSMEEFIEEKGKKNEFNKRLSKSMEEFLEKIELLKIKDLKNQTDRHLSFFGRGVEEHFGDVYSVNYFMSFACLAQAHRHRTINYQVAWDIELGCVEGISIPEIIRRTELKKEWVADLGEIAKTDFPQAQLIPITERGIREDFRSKLILRLCGHAQKEIMGKTLAIAKSYAKTDDKFDEDWLKPKCLQKIKCSSPCVWGGEKALERII